MAIPLPHLLNYLTSSSPQLITSYFHLPLSHSHLLNSLTSPSPQLIAPPISYLNPMLGIFFLVSMWSLQFCCCLSLKCAFFPFWFLIGFAEFHAFIYLVFLFYSIFLFFGFWCSLFRWFYNFVVPKLFLKNVLIVALTLFIFLFILMLYNIRLIRLDIFPNTL